MFLLLVFVCSLRLSAGATLGGQVLWDGDATKSIRIPDGSTAIISLQDTSVADASAISIKEIRVKDLSSLPYTFEMEIPDDLPAGKTYSLSVRITNGFSLLFINDEHVRAPVNGESPVTINIPVKKIGRVSRDVPNDMPFFNIKERSWPEMVGKRGTYAVEEIKKQTGFTEVVTILENSPMTMDFRTDRVRVVINSSGIVTAVPRTG